MSILRKIPYSDCTELFSRFELSTEGLALVNEGMSPSNAIDGLKAQETFLDLIGLFAHGLPPREAICWALSIFSTYQDRLSSDENLAVTEIRDWVKTPSESRRQNCQKHADMLGTNNPIGWLCLAVAWNGSGSILAPDQTEVLPQPFLYANALLGAIGLLAPNDLNARSKFIDLIHSQGLSTASGTWTCLQGVG